MKQPERVLRDLVEQWIAKADVDYRAAGVEIRYPGDFPELLPG